MEYMLLKEVCDIRDGTHNSPKYVQSGYPLVTSKNIVDGRLDLSVVGKVSEEDYNKINERSKVDIGDIIMPMIGTIGNPIIIADFCDFAIKNVALIKFPNKNVYNRYIWYFLKSTAFKRYIKEKNKGGTQKFLSLGDIRNIQVPLISFSKQIELIEKLDLINDIISLRKKELLLLDNIIKARFVDMFGDLVVNPYKWTVVKLSDISLFLKSGLSRRLSDVDIGLPVIRSGNIQNGQFVYNDIKYWYKDDPQGANTEDYRLENGDILVNFINSASQIGKTAIFSGVNRECIYTTNILRMKLTDSCNIYYYNWFAMSDYYYMQLRNIIQPAVNQASFTTVNFLKLNIPLPPLKLQNQFETFVHQVNKSKLITYYHHKSIYTKPQLCCKMVIVNDFLNTKRF